MKKKKQGFSRALLRGGTDQCGIVVLQTGGVMVSAVYLSAVDEYACQSDVGISFSVGEILIYCGIFVILFALVLPVTALVFRSEKMKNSAEVTFALWYGSLPG